MTSILKVNEIRANKIVPSTATRIEFGSQVQFSNGDVGGTQYVLGKVVVESDVNNWTHNSSTTWKEWPTAGFTNHTGFTGGSTLHIEYWMPMRHDASGWGGAYIDTNITFDDGVSWRSLGNPGYDGGVMANPSNTIHGQNIIMIITGTPSTEYSVKLRWMVKGYDSSTFYINQSHDINRTATAGFCPAGSDGIADTRLPGLDSLQHYGSYRIYEYIPVS